MRQTMLGGEALLATHGAIEKARRVYKYGRDDPIINVHNPLPVHRRNASSETVERCEKFINGPHADPRAIEQALADKSLKRATSGHLYIQLLGE